MRDGERSQTVKREETTGRGAQTVARGDGVERGLLSRAPPDHPSTLTGSGLETHD